MCVRGRVFVCLCVCVRQQFHKDALLVVTPTHKESHVHECGDISRTPLSVNFKKSSKPEWKFFGRAALSCFCLWKHSKKFCIPQTFHFPVSAPDANWQTEGTNEINNHTNKGEGGRETTTGQRKGKERERERDRKHHTSKILHHLLGHSMARRKTKLLSAPLYLSIFLSAVYLVSFLLFAFLSIRTWLWELLPQDLWSWKSLWDLSPNPTLYLQTRDGGTR